MAAVTGNRHLYTAQQAPIVPKQVQFPVIIVNPDNEVECGRKIFLDRTPSSKQDPDNYFTSKVQVSVRFSGQRDCLTLPGTQRDRAFSATCKIVML